MNTINIMSNSNTQISSAGSCNICSYWYPIAARSEELPDGQTFGKCKRNPPVLLVQDGTTYSGQPIVSGSEYCGEFKSN